MRREDLNRDLTQKRSALFGIIRYLASSPSLLECPYPVVIVIQAGAAQISGGGHCGASCAPADHLRFQMVNRHRSFTSFFLFLFLFRKRENGRASCPSISAPKLPAAGLRRQAATGVENFYPQFSAPVAGNLPSAQTMTAEPCKCCGLSVAFRRKRNPPRRAHVFRRKYHCPLGW